MMTLKERIKREGQSFLNAVRRSNETIYLILLTMYVFLYLILKTAWSNTVSEGISNFRYGLLSIVMWGAAIYLFFIIADWKKLWKNTPALVIIGGILISLTYFFSHKMTTNSYGVVFDVYFCLIACGKDFKKMIRCIMYTTIVMLLVAAIGLKAGYTWNLVKPENVSPGNSLGIEYPNTWGYIAFLALMILWYLRLRHKPLLTFITFWTTTAFMYFYISCRTIAVLAAVFPVLAIFVDWLERWAKERQPSRITVDLSEGEKKRRAGSDVGIFGWFVTAMPFLAFAFMYFASMQYKWVHKHLYSTKLYTFAMRFVQGGLYFETYGLPIFGNPYNSNYHTFVNVNGTFEEVGILDSSFAAYIIMRGLFWLTYTLAWLSYAIYKAIKRLDYAIPFLTAIILVFAMMERPGLEMWYCFILLYPLAKVANDPLEKVVAEAAPVEAVTDAVSAEEAPIETETAETEEA